MNKIILLLTFCFYCSLLRSQNFQKHVILNDHYGREAEFGDFDRDGDLDILIFYTEEYRTGNPFSKVLENINGEFFELDFELPVVESFGSTRGGAMTWVDINKDGYLDIFQYIDATFYAGDTKLFINNHDKTFTEVDIDINDLNLESCGPNWGDFDNDGDLDLALFGDQDINDFTILIYENKLNENEFVPIDMDLTNSILKSRQSWADFNNDGYLDLLINERTDNFQTYISILKNNGDKTFDKIEFPELQGLSTDVLNQSGDMRWGDYNSDGYVDIIISGQHTSSNGYGITKLYKNNGDETFENVNIGSVYNNRGDTSIEWGDFDNDGDFDILQTGISSEVGTLNKTRLFENQEIDFIESSIDTFLNSHQCGMSTFGDYNGDNNLDILVLGEESFTNHEVTVFENVIAMSNTPPTPPLELNFNINGNNVILDWTEGSDNETITQGLSYNIYLIHNNDTIINPLALENGRRVVVDRGNAQQNKFYKLNNLQPGTYRWGVQSIDNSFIGSEFSIESTFEILTTSAEALNKFDQINIFPSPFDNYIEIQGTYQFESSEVFINDAMGKNLIYELVTSFPHKLKTDFLPAGTYSIIVKIDKNTFLTRNLIKIKG